MALIYFLFIIKREPLVGETIIESESAVAQKIKKVQISFFQNALPTTIFYHRQRNIWRHILNLVLE